MAHLKTSAELEAEVELQRRRLEDRVTEIQARLSPGQLLDEALSYARKSGGGEFVNNLGRSVQANPLPVALTGIGLAWLMARGTAAPAGNPARATVAARNVPPSYARITGSALRRAGDATDDAGRRYVHFVDGAGTRFKAFTDEFGNRAGHFTDEAGQTYHGFTDAAGDRVSAFLDEAGTRLDDAQGWASQSWDNAQDRLADIAGGLADGAAEVRYRTAEAADQLQRGAEGIGRNIRTLLDEQPLIGAAVAFAVGAAIAAALPPTAQEDALVGERADDVKAQGARLAADAYSQGKQQVAEAYDALREEAAGSYQGLREDLDAAIAPTTH